MMFLEFLPKLKKLSKNDRYGNFLYRHQIIIMKNYVFFDFKTKFRYDVFKIEI